MVKVYGSTFGEFLVMEISKLFEVPGLMFEVGFEN